MLKKTLQECVTRGNPLEAPDYTAAQVQALIAVAQGVASDEQQRVAMRFIIKDIACTYDTVFRPDSERLTSFAAGKARVGQMIVHFIEKAPTHADANVMSDLLGAKEYG